jgi:hypothetical protein
MAEISNSLETIQSEESWVIADEGCRVKEGSAVDSETRKEVGEHPDLDLEK